jgi:hypothetical protein
MKFPESSLPVSEPLRKKPKGKPFSALRMTMAAAILSVAGCSGKVASDRDPMLSGINAEVAGTSSASLVSMPKYEPVLLDDPPEKKMVDNYLHALHQKLNAAQSLLSALEESQKGPIFSSEQSSLLSELSRILDELEKGAREKLSSVPKGRRIEFEELLSFCEYARKRVGNAHDTGTASANE